MRRALLLASMALLVLPATTLGATRYASPGGAGSGTCTEGAPCSLPYAITAAAAGDEVIVTPGTYPVAAKIEATVPLNIHGAAGQPRPRIVGAKEVTPLESGELLQLSNLAIESTESTLGTLFAYANGDVFDHLELIAKAGSGPLALRAGMNWSLTDSLLVAKGLDSVGVFVQGVAPGAPTMRNDTVIAEGSESFAVAISGVAPITALIEATNVIAIAEVAAEARDSSGSMTSIAFDHSALQGKVIGKVTSTAAVTAPPQFVDAAAGNYHEAAGSPTIDAGIENPFNGVTDLDGNTRSLPERLTCGPPSPPAVVDVGAFEFVPTAPPCVPTPSTVPGTTLGKATIKGRTAKFRFTATEALATGFECKLDGKSWLKCSSPVTYKHLRPGRHALRVRAVGTTGADATPALREFRIHRPHHRHHHHGHRVG